MRKFIMDKYNLIAFAIGLIPTILLYLFPPDAAVPFWAFSIVLFLSLIHIYSILLSFSEILAGPQQ